MRNSPLENNRAFTLLKTAWHALASVFSSSSLLISSLFGKEKSVLPPNRFFDVLHFLFVSGPRHYWKHPTGIAAGRSASTFLHFLLEKERRFVEKTDKKGFTLIEVMVSITVLSIILVAGFQSLGQIAAFRSNVTDRVDLGQDLYYNVERLVGIIKEGWALDYEEYWDREATGTGMSNGHYSTPTGFGNYWVGGSVGTAGAFWAGTYSCMSGNGAPMGTGGCLPASGAPQRYGEYALQFIDLNSDANGDNGDPDGNGSPVGDDDDEDLGAGPATFVTGEAQKELYLIKKNQAVPERLALRWSVVADPDAPASATCDTATATGSGCLGRLEMLRLVGRDYGVSHDKTAVSAGLYDGKTDTWECRNDFHCAGAQNTPVGSGSSFDPGNTEWVSVFSSDINVADISFHPFPNKDYRLSWKENDPKIRIAPYVRIDITLGFSWNRRKRIDNGSNPRTHIVTSVSLSD